MKKLFAAALITSAMAASASAQTSVLLDVYGRGVHAYYQHRSADAIQYFTDAINNGLEDPRAYYFRGLASMVDGNTAAAEADWTTGAELEARGKIVGDIGDALIRIQGPHRLRLEEIRLQERLRFLSMARQRSEARFGEIDAAQPDVIRPLPNAPTPPPAPPVAPDADDPFGAPATEPAVDAADAFEGAEADPFADEPAPADDAPMQDAPAAGDDPFNDGGADPFGGTDDAGADPFGGGDDPFGDDPFN